MAASSRKLLGTVSLLASQERSVIFFDFGLVYFHKIISAGLLL